MRTHFLLALCCLLTPPALARAKKCERQFRVSVNAYQPYYSVNREGEVSGLSYDLVKELERRIGCTFNQQGSEVPRMFEDFQNWRIDIITFMAASETAAKYGNFIELFTVHRKLVLIKSSFVKGKSIKEYLNDPKIKFANQIGAHPYLTDSELELLKKQNRLTQMPSPELAYQKLLDGKLNAFFASAIVHRYYVKQRPEIKDNVAYLMDPYMKVPVGLLVSKKRINEEDFKRIKEAVDGMRSDGTLRNILLKYVEPEDLQDYELAKP